MATPSPCQGGGGGGGGGVPTIMPHGGLPMALVSVLRVYCRLTNITQLLSSANFTQRTGGQCGC